MTWFYVVYIIISVAAMAYSYYAQKRANNSGRENMAATGLDGFSITTAEEGMVVPLIYGRVRRAGNILWYGNLKTEAMYGGGGGGKGGGGSDYQIVGYKYYLDIWVGLCQGKVRILKTYIQDKEREVQCEDIIFNDGTGSEFPAEPGPLANRLPGVAHIFYKQLYLGENVTYVPTIHYVLERVLSSPVDYADLPNGANPAAINYDLLLQGGASSYDMDLASFNQAALFWKNKGYGLNFDFARQQKMRDCVASVLSFVDGAVTIDENDRFVLKASDPQEAASQNLTADDFTDFVISRRSWDDTFNFLRANYIDETKDFVRKPLAVYNPANIRLVGHKQDKSIDLSAFRDRPTASKRLWEIMKWLSYPEAQLEVRSNLALALQPVGNVIRVNHDEYGINAADFRIMEKDLPEIDSNEVGFKAIQMVETLFDDSFSIGGGSGWVPPDTQPGVLVHQRVLELPFNPITGYEPAFLLLAARVHSFETGCFILTSNTGTDYAPRGKFEAFSQRGVLAQAYPVNTYTIDDETGILYTPYREDPIFTAVSRTDLFAKLRLAVIDNEIVRFQSVTPEGGASIRLKGCVRGCFNTAVATHSTGAEIWLTEVVDNILLGISAGQFQVKLLPYFNRQSVDPADVTAMTVTVQNKARVPYAPGRVEAVRAGSSVQVTWWSLTKGFDGAGTKEEQAYTDTWPFNFDGNFEYRIGSGSWSTVSATQVNLSQSGAFSLSIKNVVDGRESEIKTLSVGAADGTYVV